MTMEMTGDGWKRADVVFEGKSFAFLHRDELDHIFATIQRTGAFYELELLEALGALLRPGDWVVDAGANIGNHAIYFAGVCGCHVLAFEPNPVAAEILRKNVEANGLGDRVEIHQIALGSQAGSGDVVMPHGHNLGMASVRAADGDTGAVRIDCLSNLAGDRTIRLLKIDAEGMDYDVLAGAGDVLSRDGCAVSIEAPKREAYLKIAGFMEGHGYMAAGSYNYTPTHIFLHERQDDPQAFKALMARQTALAYIDYASLRDALNRNRRDITNQIGQVSAAVAHQTKGLPGVLSSMQSATTETMRDHMEAGLSRIGGEIAEFSGKTGAMGAEIRTMLDGHGQQLSSGLSALGDRMEAFEKRLEQSATALESAMAVLRAMEERLGDLSDRTEQAVSQLSGLEQSIVGFRESSGEQLSGIGRDIASLVQNTYTMSELALLRAEADDLQDEIQHREQIRLRTDIEALKQHFSGEKPAAQPTPPVTARPVAPVVRPKPEAPAPQQQQPKVSESVPAVLERQFARGVIAHDEPLRYQELVSIIMPSYNNETWLAQAIHSALSQKWVQVEVIVVDDGSTDGSAALARKVAATAPNVRVISLLRNFGCYYARNIAVMHAKGEYVTLLDSDDIMTTDRIAVQLKALKSKPGAIASQCRLRRWNADFTRPLSDLKHAENSLLWRRDIIDTMGGYDTVRFGGDTEFRMRLQRNFGAEAIVRIPDELYFLRTVENSLTSHGGSQAYSLEGETLKLALSPERQAYSKNMADWYENAKTPRVEFPQMSRPFDLGSLKQNASPSLGQRRVGTMASFPPRRESLQAAISSILPQVDQLVLYLNNYPDVPDFTSDSRIRVVRSQDAVGDLRDNGKFYDLPVGDDAYIFTFDDDLIYPANYVAHMVHYIEMLGRSSVVGLHGVIFPETKFTKLQQRAVFHFAHAHKGNFVDLLGTGTTAWHSSALRLTLDDFGSKGICDLWFAAAAAKRRVPLFSVPREADWLQLYSRFDENLYEETFRDPKAYFDIFNQILGPALHKGAVRRNKEVELVKTYGIEALTMADIEIRSVAKA